MKTRLHRTRANTLMEVMIASALFALFGLLTVVIFRVGAGGWKKLEARSSLLSDYQVVTGRVTREVQRSVFGSASVDAEGHTLALLCAVDEDGLFHLDSVQQRPLWERYLVFYYVPEEKRLYLREVPLAAGAPERETPEPLEEYDAGTGDLTDYRNGGRLLMSDLDDFRFQLGDELLTLEAQASRLRYGDSEPETLSLGNTVSFRN